jgi:predicted unusual protein kinase regulating ubiquinone biosynthesis (AarF/ABC1/UbiB family)
VSNLADVFPEQVLKALKMFQDQLPALPPEQAQQILKEELGVDPQTIFRDLDFTKPISTGSIAVLYEAKVQNIFGHWKDVVVKVQRPGLKETLDYNRRLNRLIIQFIKISGGQVAPLMDFIGDQVIGLEDAFEGELDFKKELRNIQRFSHWFRFNKNVQIPSVYPKYSTKKVLVMEKAEGSNLEKNLKALIVRNQQNPSAESTEKKSLESTYVTIFENMVYMLMVTKELHADLHPGNILAVLEEEENTIRLNKKIVMLDYGQTTKTKGFIWVPLMAGYNLLTGNAEGLAKRLIQMGKDPDFPPDLLIEAIKKIFAENRIEQVKMSSVIRKKSNLNKVESMSKALGQIVKVAFQDLGYRSNPRYFQVLRSSLPVVSTLLLIGKNFTPAEVGKLSLSAFARGLTWGSIYYLSSIPSIAMGELKTNFIEALDKYKNRNSLQSQGQGYSSLKCEAAFAN